MTTVESDIDELSSQSDSNANGPQLTGSEFEGIQRLDDMAYHVSEAHVTTVTVDAGEAFKRDTEGFRDPKINPRSDAKPPRVLKKPLRSRGGGEALGTNAAMRVARC